ncbi:MAG: choice-of-anchor tandem repeat GloVer-containing protein, partial [Verrucomicrobiaceae bacterium]
ADGTDDSQTVTITATDNGSPAQVSTSTFALTVKNVAPTALAQSVTAAEDTSKAITLGATDPGQDTLTFSVVTGPTEAQGTLSVVSGNQVTFTPALNFNGSASFTFKATDSDGAVSNTALVSIEVTESNDVPSFGPGSNISIPSGSALQQVQWASSITAGADDESEQALSFVVINDNNTIFAVQPSIDAEGVLTYQPAFAARVVATVTVTLVETAEGGLASAPHTFTISMTGDPGSGVFETMSTFANSAAGPKGPIVRDAYGSLWGTTAMGGLANQGTIWKLNATGHFRTVADLGTAASFNAKKGGGLVRGFDGNFYITATGDATGFGSVLRVSPDGALSSVQTSTGSQTAAATVLGSDGFLYGGNKTALIKLAPTSGIVWSAKLPANTVLRYPLLEWLDGNFYGTSVLGGTSNLGVVFKVSRTGQYTVVKNLTAALGSRPSGSLITGHDGAMYGVTSTGGANGTGTVFRVTSSGNHRIVASFPAGAGSPGNIVLGSDGCYYGTRFSGTFGAIYKMTASGVLSTLVTFTGATGIAPGAVTGDTVESLLYGQDGILYGATGLGGTANGGVLYSLTTTGTYNVLRHMAAVTNDPQGALADDSVGNHFGTNATGGTGQGSIFAVAPDGVVTDIHTFSGNDGSSPQSGLAFASNGNYYGTTSTGGTAGLGTLFRMTPDGVVTTLFSFTGTTGLYRGSTPLGPLTASTNGSLYGTTSKGGSSNLGTVFSLTNLNGVPTYTVLANFTGKNGSTPVGGVAIDSDGKLFGTTRSGGAASRGCIYNILGPDTGTPALSVVASFTGTTGLAPGNNSQATLIRGVDGKFYGTARQGGASDAGTLFRISSAGVFELLISFTNTSGLAIGKQPEGIVQGPDGRIYGTTALGGAAGFGVLFALDPATKAYTVRKQFEGGSLGIQGRGLPLMGRDGNLYGFTASTVWRMTFAKQPTARTRLATAVTSTSATLNGTVNANGLNTTVQFEFGPTTAYGTTRSAMPAPAFGTADTLVSLPVANLEPHTIYHYRLLVTAGAHVLASADQTVTTLNTAPEAFSDTIVTNASMNIVADELPDQDGDLLDIHSVALPAAGTLARLSATNVQYTPTAELATRGYDQFIYQVGDGTDMSPPALLTVRYQPPTGSPPALPADAVVLPTSAEAYATWATAALPNTVAGDDRLPDGDADRDRISNALECLMATNPTVSNASTFIIDTSGNPAFSKVRYTRQKGLVEGFETLEESTDGMNWRAVDHSRQLMKRTNGTITDSVETTIVPVPGTNALPYFRLVISL